MMARGGVETPTRWNLLQSDWMRLIQLGLEGDDGSRLAVSLRLAPAQFRAFYLVAGGNPIDRPHVIEAPLQGQPALNKTS